MRAMLPVIMLGGIASCSLNVDYTGTYYECGENDSCPEGYVCKAQVCIPTEPAPTTCTSAVSAGIDHSCAIRDTDGTVWCWGRNNQGQLGNNTTTDSNIPVQTEGITDAKSVVTGYDFTCAIVGSDRNVLCWGANDSGQLGDNSMTGSRTPVQAGTLSGIEQITVGYNHTCSRDGAGTVSCWGANSFNQLGDGSQSSHRTPVAVSGVTATAIAATDDSTCAVDNKQLVCWGENSSGMFMNGTTDNPPTPLASTLVSDVAGVALGEDHLCIFNGSGEVLCAGTNADGELGNGTTGGDVSTPVLAPIPEKVIALSLGPRHSCAVDDQGGAWCWGDDEGKLGLGRQFDFVSSPVLTEFEDVESISAGDDHTCARSHSGAIACAGFNGFGQLGNGSRITQGSPIPVPDLTNVTGIAVGGDFSCALEGNGAVSCWGNGEEGELGDGGFHVRPKPAPAIATGVKKLIGGGDHVCAILMDDTVSCWGRGSSGQLGTGDTSSRGAPLAIAGLTGVVQLAAGDNHTCAVTASTLTCWGANGSGQLGDTGVDPELTPTAVPNFLDGPAKAVAAGGSHTCAIDSLGEVQCWGSNSVGQLGDNTQSGNSVPVKVVLKAGGLLQGVEAISARGSKTFALAGGKIFAWGFGCNDLLGSFDADCSATLAAVEVADIDTATEVSGGYTSSCAIKSDGSVACWGQNYFGQIGDGTYNQTTPVSIVGVTASDVSAGGEHACAVTTGKTAVCWGGDYTGQLGDNVVEDIGPNFVRMTCQ